ncbi:putative tripartite motif-containing protein 2-like isoform X1 [Apostichopus japonicus]|uniref:Putative tripartite motif-containing protein 2-like isoform X1 n=1 Tax=Stichopus japonicus TaxID=307972 RepID=A0A2G8L4U4_STIJA|nr:putative tripartite motif-containing protein 2-like isoform X1 [Apostichopus japonicus]
MEGASATVTLRLTGEFLCPDCQRLFDKPKVLSCGHSICQKCIRQRCQTIPHDKKEITCPKCKCGILLPSSGGTDDFPENYSLTSVLSILKLTPEIQELENHVTGNGGKMKPNRQTSKEIQRFTHMLKQLEKDFVEITNIKENANTAIQTLSQSKNHVNKQINETADEFLTRLTLDMDAEKNKLIKSVEETYLEKFSEANATLEKAKVLEATIFSAKEVTSSILAALEREDADLKSGPDIGVKVEGLVKNVDRKMADIRKRKVPSGLDVRFEPSELNKLPSIGHLSDLLYFVGTLWVNTKELILLADSRQERHCVTLRVVNCNDVTKILWEGEISPSDKEAPITAMMSPFRTGTILISVGVEIFVLGVSETTRPSSAVTESVMSLDVPKGTHITSLSVRHDGNIMVATNLSNMILVFTEDGRSTDVIQTLAEDDVMHPISMCSISYYRTAVCCFNADKVIVLSHSWNAAKLKDRVI